MGLSLGRKSRRVIAVSGWLGWVAGIAAAVRVSRGGPLWCGLVRPTVHDSGMTDRRDDLAGLVRPGHFQAVMDYMDTGTGELIPSTLWAPASGRKPRALSPRMGAAAAALRGVGGPRVGRAEPCGLECSGVAV